jgi:dipeptidyl aminopeptidase/acylaminoacyl peptidase
MIDRQALRFVIGFLCQIASWGFFGLCGAQVADKYPKNGVMESKRSITVKDAIEMTRLAGHEYFVGVDAEDRVAMFSPDRKQFVVTLRKASLENNTIESSMYLFRSAEAPRSPAPHLLLTMSSTSNREAISGVRWLADNKTIVFLGERPAGVAQLYALNVENDRLEKLTKSPAPVVSYDITPDGNEILYLAMAEIARSNTDEGDEGVVVIDQSLTELLAGKGTRSPEKELFAQHRGSAATPIPLPVPTDGRVLSLSPNGKWGIVDAPVLAQDLPASWSEYLFPENEFLQGFFHHVRGPSPFKLFLLVDIGARSVKTVGTGPAIYLSPATWGKTGDEVFLGGVYVPVDRQNDETKRKSYIVAVNALTGEFRPVTAVPGAAEGTIHEAIKVVLDEGINTPPKIVAVDTERKQRSLLLDLNPQFDGLKFGDVEEIHWKVHGYEIVGGLYLPPGYQRNKKYPLIIQTHGFTSKRFSMDGLDEWSSGYAARPLAANGFIVLQAYDFSDREAHNGVARDRTLGRTSEESFKHFNALAYEGAIDHLDHEGMIDPARVGISGFSRTVCSVGYTLTHSRRKFAAAVLTDGIDCGYFNYMAFPHEAPDANALNGGHAPFGEEGLRSWREEAPAFNLDRNYTPVRLVALDFPSLLQSWEWFIGLKFQGRPAELVILPGASHLLERPEDRRVAMQGIVDWFSFWLKNEESEDSLDPQEFLRWKELRDESELERNRPASVGTNRE